MNDQSRIPVLVRLSLGAATLGVLLCLPLLVQETPFTFVAFMFLAQPLLAGGFLLFAIQVFRDLKGRQAL